MRSLGFPSLRHYSDDAVSSQGDRRKILEDLYLESSNSLGILISSKTVSATSASINQSNSISLSSKTISRSNVIVNQALSIITVSKTRTLTVGVFNLALTLFASGKTITIASVVVNAGEQPSGLQLSAKTVTHCEIVIKRLTIGQRINNSVTTLITKPVYARLEPRFRQ